MQNCWPWNGFWKGGWVIFPNTLTVTQTSCKLSAAKQSKRCIPRSLSAERGVKPRMTTHHMDWCPFPILGPWVDTTWSERQICSAVAGSLALQKSLCFKLPPQQSSPWLTEHWEHRKPWPAIAQDRTRPAYHGNGLKPCYAWLVIWCTDCKVVIRQSLLIFMSHLGRNLTKHWKMW